MTLPPKHLIGLTGSIASGKSTVLKTLAACGAQTFSADEIVRELYQTPRVQRHLQRWFGSALPGEVAKRVFGSAQDRQKLEKFLHPLVWKLAQERLAACPNTWAVFEVPLLFEAGWQTRMDFTILVVGDKRTLATRLRARGLSAKDYQQRLATQWTQEEKICHADLVIYNDGSKPLLVTKAKRLYKALANLYA